MIRESVLLGIAGIILGIGILIKTKSILPALVPIGIGIALMTLYKEEDKIEQRKDK